MSKLTKALTAAAGNAGGTLGYVEDVFSTYLYSGTGGDGNTAQTITNGIDLDGEGGLVWIQERDDGSNSYSYVADSERGSTKYLTTQVTNAEGTQADAITSFNSDGFTLGLDSIGRVNYATGSPLTGRKYASWTFRKAEKFFDVVTYTGTGSAQTIAHNLGSVPGMIIVKGLDIAENWIVYHTSLGATKYIQLNTTGAAGTSSIAWNDTEPTSTEFTVNTFNAVNEFGYSYVAYVFASDAGGFGDDGSENIIKCGSFTGNGSKTGPTVSLGWEPQYILMKNASAAYNWHVVDVMRGISTGPTTLATGDEVLYPNLSNAEISQGFVNVTADGFEIVGDGADNPWYNGSGNEIIYIAIRRPMKVPEAGTEVFYVGTDPVTTPFDVGFVPDLSLATTYDQITANEASTRLQGAFSVETNATSAEAAYTAGWDDSTGFWSQGNNGGNVINYLFKRAPEFMDVVCYTGTGVDPMAEPHGLGVVPELIIIKNRGSTEDWNVFSAFGGTARMFLNTTAAETATGWTGDIATATEITLGTGFFNNNASNNYVAYLFATLAGISKVGSYTGTAADLDLDMGFAAGARFFLTKRTDATGDWYLYDSARGIVAGNDPYLLLNSNAAETTGTDYVDPLASGITLTAAGSATININTATYIYLAIA